MTALIASLVCLVLLALVPYATRLRSARTPPVECSDEVEDKRNVSSDANLEIISPDWIDLLAEDKRYFARSYKVRIDNPANIDGMTAQYGLLRVKDSSISEKSKVVSIDQYRKIA